jgi:F0F1-type ATP synthase membrane subunit c/vacuolar-type H+-ATPase subunit K
MTFGKVARSGVEAVGRNPLAKTSILTGVLFNISIGAVIILSGVGVAYLIIKL